MGLNNDHLLQEQMTAGLGHGPKQLQGQQQPDVEMQST